MIFNCHQSLLRFILIHLSVTNVCQWFKTVVFEIHEDFLKHAEGGGGHGDEEDHGDTLAGNITNLLVAGVTAAAGAGGGHGGPPAPPVAGGHGDGEDHRLLAAAASSMMAVAYDNVAPGDASVSLLSNTTMKPLKMKNCHGISSQTAAYLFPCAIEYSLIAAAIFYKMFKKVGHMVEESQRMRICRTAFRQEKKYSECHKSHKGLFLGLVTLMATLVAFIAYRIIEQEIEKTGKHDHNNLAVIAYQCVEVGLMVISLIISLVAIRKLTILRRRKSTGEEHFDDKLLVVGLVGILAYNFFNLIPSLTTRQRDYYTLMCSLRGIAEVAQTLVQSFLIIECSRRCAGRPKHIRDKPGRSLITFLLVANLAMWIINIFEVNRAEDSQIQKRFYSEDSWTIISHLLIPMIIFFRFHSTVCLSDIWTKAYRFHI